MALIKSALSALLGTGKSDHWLAHLRPASFGGVPFGVLSGESVFGRRQAVHEYPYREQAWIEDMGRSTRRITIKGFLVHDSQVYSAPDVMTQRNNLVAVCEAGKTGTLNHPTLGEMTVSVTESGLRLHERVENGRVFEFELVVIESGLKVFAITGSENAQVSHRKNYLAISKVAAAKFIAAVKGEMRTLTQARKVLKQTVEHWINLANATLNEASNLSDALKSTFGSEQYGRYQKGDIGGWVSGATGQRKARKVTDTDTQLSKKIRLSALISRHNISEALTALARVESIEQFTTAVQSVFILMIDMPGSDERKWQIFETLSFFEPSQFYPGEGENRLATLTHMLLVVLAASALSVISGGLIPTNSYDAARYQKKLCQSLDNAIRHTGDLALDEIYLLLLDMREQGVSYFIQMGSEQGQLAQYQLPDVLPALTVAHRLYQDARRSDELVMEVSPHHPAFMPPRFKALAK
ncbi:DNA circularization N-terminal domain-containing protein [Arsenophonus nasoniae]|uniref:DNA circularization N-terminal domain-containing protein n=1 Tax=Arsenophonus nasoniae TaxID=638 RepID=UPI00387A398E